MMNNLQTSFLSLLPASLGSLKDFISTMIMDCSTPEAIREETESFLVEDGMDMDAVEALFQKLKLQESKSADPKTHKEQKTTVSDDTVQESKKPAADTAVSNVVTQLVIC
jgi:hypothetical protein